MKKDGEIKLLIDERGKGASQKLAAARAGVSECTTRKYEQVGMLPSQMKKAREHRTRDNPFAGDWPWVEAEIRDDPALQAKTLLALLCAAFPGRYQEGQLRTLQRHAQAWRVRHGPGQEVMFAQLHQPGPHGAVRLHHHKRAGREPCRDAVCAPVYHLVLTYPNVEAARVCFSESFEALAEGLESVVCGKSPMCPFGTAPTISRRRCVVSTTTVCTNLPGTTGRCWPTTACSRLPTVPVRRIRMATSSSRTFTSSKPSIRHCGCVAVATSPTAGPTSASWPSCSGSAISRAPSASRSSGRRCITARCRC